MSKQYAERETQNRVIRLFEKLGYDFLGDWRDRKNIPVVETLLKDFLKCQGWSDAQAVAVADKLRQEAALNARTLYDANRAVYGLMRHGVNVRLEAGENDRSIFPIDWQNPENNHFALAEEVKLAEGHERRPDLVVYINGLAVAVIELKKGSVSIVDGIAQLISNQSADCNPGFFTTAQILIAASNSEGLRYGTIGTPAKHYLPWKEPHEESHDYVMDIQLEQIFRKERIIELLRDFVIFDAGKKKLPRPHQYFGIKAAQNSIARRQGGIIWHSQGSGKSLVMVLLARWLLETNPQARILVVTDRVELDTQIERVFRDAGEGRVKHIAWGNELVPALASHEHRLMCALIHKFGTRAVTGEQSIKEYVRHLQDAPAHAAGELFVFVDECHRTQGGNLYSAMRQTLRNAVFIGFTGTPLLKADRKTTMELFGGYIHTYKFNEAVEDGVVLNLLYEARDIDQRLGSSARLDELFEKRAQPLTRWQKEELKRRWTTMQQLLSSRDRMEKIVGDISFDFETKDILSSGHGNAILVAANIRDACKYYDIFQNSNKSGLKGHVGLVTSYNPTRRDAQEDMGDNSETDRQFIYRIYREILAKVKPSAGRSAAETYEEEVKKQFIEQPDKMKVLIVVDKLLTGFDAVPCSYIYLDRHLQDHGLFQAICRTNRVAYDEEDWKPFGNIVDYKDLFKKVQNAMAVYTSEIDMPPDDTDPEILLRQRLELLRDRLEAARDGFAAIMENVPAPKNDLEIIRHFCGNSEKQVDLDEHQPLRELLYHAVVKLLRAYAALADELAQAGYGQEDVGKIVDEIKTAEHVRGVVRKASGEDLDLRSFEAGMRDLLDRYVEAEEPRAISSFGDRPLLDIVAQSGMLEAVKRKFGKLKMGQEAVAESVENNLRRALNDAMSTNPVLYEKMSVLLNDLIAQRKAKAIEYEKYLQELMDKIVSPLVHQEDRWPKSCDTPAKRALYYNLGENEGLALALYADLVQNRPADWRQNRAKQNNVKSILARHLGESAEVVRIFAIIMNLDEFR